MEKKQTGEVLSPPIESNKSFPKPRTEEEFNSTKDKLWGDIPLGDFSIGYRERAQSIMNQVTLAYMTTLEDLTELRIQMDKETYDKDKKLVDFCKSMARATLENCEGAMEKVIFKIAGGLELEAYEIPIRYKLMESVAKSHTVIDKTHPFKNAWFKEE